MLYVNDTLIHINHFPDGTPLIKLNDITLTNDPITITWLYDDDTENMALMFITRHLQSKGYRNINLVIPYIPNARFDRVKSNTEVFTLKWFAEFINSLNFNNVIVLDPHSYVNEALINNIIVVSPADIIATVLDDITDNKDDIVLFFPDEGAMKRYSEIANTYGLKCVFASKNRDWTTGEIKGLNLHGNNDDVLSGKNILIIDDICSKGGTFYYSAKALKDANANKIYLYVSHCENTVLKGELYDSNLVEKIFTTNSIFRNKNEDVKDLINITDITMYMQNKI